MLFFNLKKVIMDEKVEKLVSIDWFFFKILYKYNVIFSMMSTKFKKIELIVLNSLCKDGFIKTIVYNLW